MRPFCSMACSGLPYEYSRKSRTILVSILTEKLNQSQLSCSKSRNRYGSLWNLTKTLSYLCILLKVRLRGFFFVQPLIMLEKGPAHPLQSSFSEGWTSLEVSLAFFSLSSGFNLYEATTEIAARASNLIHRSDKIPKRILGSGDYFTFRERDRLILLTVLFRL